MIASLLDDEGRDAVAQEAERLGFGRAGGAASLLIALMLARRAGRAQRR